MGSNQRQIQFHLQATNFLDPFDVLHFLTMNFRIPLAAAMLKMYCNSLQQNSMQDVEEREPLLQPILIKFLDSYTPLDKEGLSPFFPFNLLISFFARECTDQSSIWRTDKTQIVLS